MEIVNTITVTSICLTALVVWAFGSVLIDGEQAMKKSLMLALAISAIGCITLILN